MSKPLTDEMIRILRAVDSGTMGTNANGRYIIVGAARPDRWSRETIAKRGLIEHRYEMGRGSRWCITDKGRSVLAAFDPPTPADVKQAIQDEIAADDFGGSTFLCDCDQADAGHTPTCRARCYAELYGDTE